MARYERLDIGGVKLYAAPINDILRPPGNLQVPASVDAREISRPEPAVCCERIRRGFEFCPLPV